MCVCSPPRFLPHTGSCPSLPWLCRCQCDVLASSVRQFQVHPVLLVFPPEAIAAESAEVCLCLPFRTRLAIHTIKLCSRHKAVLWLGGGRVFQCVTCARDGKSARPVRVSASFCVSGVSQCLVGYSCNNSSPNSKDAHCCPAVHVTLSFSYFRRHLASQGSSLPMYAFLAFSSLFSGLRS